MTCIIFEKCWGTCHQCANSHDGAFGRMLTGWNEIGGRWYYFNTVTTATAPLGSLLTNGTTPDGYQVNGDEVWEQ